MRSLRHVGLWRLQWLLLGLLHIGWNWLHIGHASTGRKLRGFGPIDRWSSGRYLRRLGLVGLFLLGLHLFEEFMHLNGFDLGVLHPFGLVLVERVEVVDDLVEPPGCHEVLI